MVADAISWLDYNPTVNLTSECNHATLSMLVKRKTISKWKTYSNSGIVTINTTPAT